MNNYKIVGPKGGLIFEHLDKDKKLPWSHQKADNVEGICALCRKNKNLKLGHLIPRSFYRGETKAVFYASAIINGDKLNFTNGAINKKLQDGSKFYLLCYECEQLFSREEDYLVRFHRKLYDDYPIEFSSEERARLFTAVGGIAFRTYWAHKLFLKIDPGWPPYLEAKLRKQLLKRDCTGFYIGGDRLAKSEMEGEEGRNLFVSVPQTLPFDLSRNKNGPIFRAVFGEAEWVIVYAKPYRNGFFKEKTLDQMLGSSQLELLKSIAVVESEWLDKRL